MRKRLCVVFTCVAGIFSLFVLSGCEQQSGCKPWQRQLCFCSDGSVALQSCRDDGSGWEPCDCTTLYSVWCDNATGLCWQDPQKDAYDYSDTGLTHPDSLRYCEELVLAGHDDWRLPDIDELRTLLRGNAPSETDGECPLTEGSPMDDMSHQACAPVEEFGGPGPGGCYWPPDLSGTCDKPDPAAVGHPLEFMASTVSSDNEHWVGTIMFDNGGVCFNHIHTYAEVRCVRDAPAETVTCADGANEACIPGDTRKCDCPNGTTGAQICADDGSCWLLCECSGFEPAPPVTDVCDQCDRIQLTIKVPQNLQTAPKVLMAFLYDAETWTWPPNRPPDGGTDYNQVIAPEIDVDKPFEMTVPGCTYYREMCLSGEYMLYVALMQKETMPPVMREGDYWWGMEQDPVSLGSGSAKTIEMEVELVPYEN